MIKTKIALAVMLASVALAPAASAKSKPSKAKSSKVAKGHAASKSTHAKAAPVQAKAAPVVAERWQDRVFDNLSMQFLTALWRIDPDGAISVGKFDTAARMDIPDRDTRAKRLAFTDEWLGKLRAVNASRLSAKQRTDLTLLINKLENDRFDLTTLREFEWNPAQYNIAESLDLILTTDYAAKPQRLRTILKRLAKVPDYYKAAQASLVNPTHEHTMLALAQAPGTLVVLADLGEAAQKEPNLTPQEKAIFAVRVSNAGSAVLGWVQYLADLDKSPEQAQHARSFRLGKALYDQKFALEIQSTSTAEQTYQKALAARDQLMTRMDGLSDQLWDKTMGSTPKPADRYKKIGMVIDKLSEHHTSKENFFPEIKRQIPMLQQWVTSHNLLDLDPNKPLEVRETPIYKRGVAGASIDAPGPYRPRDKTWFNVTPMDGLSDAQAESSLREYNDWMLQILSIHEAIPGHYAQLVYANRSPSLVKSLFGNGAMVEGWAVYGERMMLDAGYGDNAPEMWLMWCKWNLRSVTNTILDYSVHVLGMTHDQAIDLLVRQAFQTPQEAEEKWRRVQLSSVQLTSYFSGYNDIMELREKRKQELGDRFDLKKFNEQFLSYGSAPVKVISELMQEK